MAKFNKTPIIYKQDFQAIDRDNGIIRGVHIAMEGEAKGHGVQLDSEFIQKVAKLGNEIEVGVKSRFGHPNMSNEALGTFIGRFHNFKAITVNDKAIATADLHLSEVAKKAPQGNLYDYVLELAEKDPEAFGNSIVFKAGKSKFVEDKETETKTEYATIESLIASDLVDSPAATDKLYSGESFAATATTFLDEHPEIFELLSESPEVLEGFLTNYNNYLQTKKAMEEKANEGLLLKDEKSFFDKLKSYFSSNESETKPVEVEPEAVEPEKVEAPVVDTSKFEAEISALKAEITSLKEASEAVIAENESLKNKVNSFAATIDTKTDTDKGEDIELSEQDKQYVDLFRAMKNDLI